MAGCQRTGGYLAPRGPTARLLTLAQHDPCESRRLGRTARCVQSTYHRPRSGRYVIFRGYPSSTFYSLYHQDKNSLRVAHHQSLGVASPRRLCQPLSVSSHRTLIWKIPDQGTCGPCRGAERGEAYISVGVRTEGTTVPAHRRQVLKGNEDRWLSFLVLDVNATLPPWAPPCCS